MITIFRTIVIMSCSCDPLPRNCRRNTCAQLSVLLLWRSGCGIRLCGIIMYHLMHGNITTGTVLDVAEASEEAVWVQRLLKLIIFVTVSDDTCQGHV